MFSKHGTRNERKKDTENSSSRQMSYRLSSIENPSLEENENTIRALCLQNDASTPQFPMPFQQEISSLPSYTSHESNHERLLNEGSKASLNNEENKKEESSKLRDIPIVIHYAQNVKTSRVRRSATGIKSEISSSSSSSSKDCFMKKLGKTTSSDSERFIPILLTGIGEKEEETMKESEGKTLKISKPSVRFQLEGTHDSKNVYKEIDEELQSLLQELSQYDAQETSSNTIPPKSPFSPIKIKSFNSSPSVCTSRVSTPTLYSLSHKKQHVHQKGEERRDSNASLLTLVSSNYISRVPSFPKVIQIKGKNSGNPCFNLPETFQNTGVETSSSLHKATQTESPKENRCHIA